LEEPPGLTLSLPRTLPDWLAEREGVRLILRAEVEGRRWPRARRWTSPRPRPAPMTRPSQLTSGGGGTAHAYVCGDGGEGGDGFGVAGDAGVLKQKPGPEYANISGIVSGQFLFLTNNKEDRWT